MASLSTLDLVIIIAYLTGIFAVGIYAFIEQQLNKKRKTESSYFLAGRDISWLAIAATLFSSNIGAEHFVGLSGTAAQSGIAVATYEWGAPLLIWILAYFTCHIYIPSGIITTPEYIEKRFNKKIRIIIAIITILLFILKTISTTIYSASVILQQVLGWEIYTSAISLIILTGIYVILGGLRSVIYTENIQTILLIIGGIIVCGYSLNAVNGFNGLRAYYDSQNEDNMHLIRPNTDSEWPWIGTIFAPIMQSYFYWNGNQLLVQRILSAKTILHAQYGSIFTSMLKILPPFMTVIPGICARVLYPNEFKNNTSTEYDRAFPLLIEHLLPSGIKGIVIAAMLSALMSSLASVYNSAAAILVNDIYKQIYPNNTHSQGLLINIGRIGSIIFIIISMLWIPIVIRSNTPIFLYVVAISATFQMPISAIFFMGNFWNRANAFGTGCCLIVGLIVGAVRFISTYSLNDDECNKFILCSMNVLFFGIGSFFLSVIVIIIGSLITTKPDRVKVDGTTYWNRWDEHIPISEREARQDMNESLSSEASDDFDNRSDEILIQRGSSLKPLLFGHIEGDEEEKNSNCFWRIYGLTGDKTKQKWRVGLHLMTLASVILTVGVWVYFW